MPVHCELRSGKYRVIEPSGRIARSANGRARDGGGHSSNAACQRQANAINASLPKEDSDVYEELTDIIDEMFDEGERLEFSFEEKQIDTEQEGSWSGIAAAFGNQDSDGDIIKPGAFAKTIMQPMKNIKILAFHKRDEPIGLPSELRETPKGLFSKGQLLMELPEAQKIHTLAKNDVLDGLSIGFRIPPGGSTLDMTTFVRTITEVDLKEISFVTFPANKRARVQRMKSRGDLDDIAMKLIRNRVEEVKTVRQMEEFLREAGLSRDCAKAMSGKFLAQREVDENEEAGALLSVLRQARANLN